MINIKVPGWADIVLPQFYQQFIDYYPTYEMETKQWMVRNVKEDWISLDVGAHIGYYSILLSELAHMGEVHAFEPTSTEEMLRANIIYNGRANVYINKTAVGAYSGEFIETIYRIWGEPPEVMPYHFITLDDYVKTLNLEKVDLVKIDVDSFDFDVLLGSTFLLEKYGPVIIIELNDALRLRNYTKQDVIEFMAERKYEVTAILDGENYIMRRL